MSGADESRTAELPDGMVNGVRDLALARISGTTPWPRVRTAVRRDRRRRAVGASAAAAGLVAATIFAAGTLLPRSAPPAGNDRQGATPAPTRPEPSHTLGTRAPVLPADRDPLNLAGSTAGSLGKDEAWLAGLKERVVGDLAPAPNVAAVRVLWATDHAGQRHALTMARKDAATAFLTLWRGAAGARPEDMHVESRQTVPIHSGRPFLGAHLYQIRTRDREDGPGLFVATGTDLVAVETATGADYDAAGRRAITWAPLQPQGPVFVRVASDAELDTVAVRAADTDGRWFRLQSGASYGDAPRLAPGLLAASPAGTDPKVLTCAADAFTYGGFPAGATPVLGATHRLRKQWLGVAVARAPSGGYLVGMCRTSRPWSSSSSDALQAEGFVVPAPAGGARDLLVLLPCKRARAGAGLDAVCVVAPEGATEVEVAGVRAEVHGRVTVVEFPRPVPEKEVQVTAHRADGKPIGPVRRPLDERVVTDAALPQRDFRQE